MLEYNGQGYAGFQLQKKHPTVQGALEAALRQLEGREVRVKGASRTDAGVHALGQVVAFPANNSLSLERKVKALNALLPLDIVVREAFWAREDFHPRRHALSREYCYLIWNAPHPSPWWRDYAAFVPFSLDLNAMQRGGEALVGEHDFASFTSPAAPAGKTVRKVYQAGVAREGSLVTFTIEANAFLPQQVRRTAGALIRAGLGKMAVEEFRGLVESPRAGAARPSAPAQGLYLRAVKYPRGFFYENN